ncbi:MAG: crotonase/enoyl-CoA hydratase family protein [Deltaproteobacteria bacterium]|nr:crotonase/enoyl-CoA hydratase family protein [Deltaproteobacteria bacterium]
MRDPRHAIVEKEGHLLTVTLNRPEARNALSPEMLIAMYDAWRQLDADDELRVAILTGAGGHFCSGADLKAMHQEQTSPEMKKRFEEVGDLHWQALLRHNRPQKPIIAAVEGYAVAGGTEILQATEIRVAAESARFGVAEVRWSLFPVGGSTVRLRRQIPFTRAAEILLTGQQISAQEALNIGLIGRIVPDGQALAEARKIAEVIAENGPLAVKAILRSLRETEGLSEEDALARELEIGLPIFATEDAREGPKAFAQKRKPNFKGR